MIDKESQRGFQVRLTTTEAQALITLLAHLVEQNPPFWPDDQGALQKLRFGPIKLCISVIDQISEQLGPSLSSTGPSQPIN